MSQTTLTALVERVNQLSTMVGLPPLSIAEPLPAPVTVWHDGMSDPDEHGAVRLQFVEETLRPAIQAQIDALNAGKKDGDESKLILPERYFVRQALETFGHDLSAFQINTIILNTGQYARQTTYVGRMYPVTANEQGKEGERLGNEYAMTYGPTAAAASREIELRYRDALRASEGWKPGDPDFTPGEFG